MPLIHSAGAKRLRWLLGSIGGFIGLVGADFYEPCPWYGYLIAVAICFVLPFALTTGITWVVEGFSSDRHPKSNKNDG
jgi:hypothetical protein